MRGTPSRTWILALAVTAAACGADGPIAPDVAPPHFAKGGNGGGDETTTTTATLVADVVAITDGQIASTCPGEVTDNWAILFGHSGCLVVPLDDYSLTDDLTFEVKTRKGQILEMKLTGQDVIGSDGIMHETDNFLDTAVQTSADGFTVSVNKTVPVYRLSGHLRGKRVGVAGHVSIGEIVYRPQE